MHIPRTSPLSTASIRAWLGMALLAVVLVGCSGLGALSGLLGNQIRITPAMLQQQLDRKFPRDYDKLGGLVRVTLANPHVGIARGRAAAGPAFDYGIGALGIAAADRAFLADHRCATNPASPSAFYQPLGTLVHGRRMRAEGATRALIGLFA